MDDQAQPRPGIGSLRRPRGPGLSAKLLMLTILFVMLGEVLIYVPSIANFRQNWLRDRLNAAQIAALVLDAAPEDMVPAELQRELLENVGAHAVAMKRSDSRRMLAISDMPPEVAYVEDMRSGGVVNAIMHAFDTLANGNGRVIRVVGDAPMEGEFVEIIIDEKPLRDAMFQFSVNILSLSIVISLITAGLVYLALNWLLVRPMRHLTANMVAFAERPEQADRIITPSGRADEIGVAESELADMQRQLAAALQQKNHLASMGLAVSKINHDLRNVLSSAQLLVDRVGAIPEPTVQRFAPKLIATLDRAIGYCTDTLKYGRAEEQTPRRHVFPLAMLVEDAVGGVGIEAVETLRFVNEVPADLMIDADRDHLFRILSNLARNAIQAMSGQVEGEAGELRVCAVRRGQEVEIAVSDTGPGVSPKAREALFKAFRGSTRAGGTGLGLAIAAELARAHGGSIRLAETQAGATFLVTIPDGNGAARSPNGRARRKTAQRATGSA
ncbi:MAG: sensor histidine kinase [Flavobacteriaceae bacterium]